MYHNAIYLNISHVLKYTKACIPALAQNISPRHNMMFFSDSHKLFILDVDDIQNHAEIMLKIKRFSNGHKYITK